jgi:azurin
LNLAIDVGFTDMVQVNQGQAPYSATCQRFNCPGTHTANADNRDMGGCYTLGTRNTIKACQATESAVQSHIEKRLDSKNDRIKTSQRLSVCAARARLFQLG